MIKGSTPFPRCHHAKAAVGSAQSWCGGDFLNLLLAQWHIAQVDVQLGYCQPLASDGLVAHRAVTAELHVQVDGEVWVAGDRVGAHLGAVPAEDLDL